MKNWCHTIHMLRVCYLMSPSKNLCMALLLKIRKASVAIAKVLGQRTEKYYIAMYSGETIPALKGMQWVVLVLDFYQAARSPLYL